MFELKNSVFVNVFSLFHVQKLQCHYTASMIAFLSGKRELMLEWKGKQFNTA